ncbi:MAG: GTPase Era [Hyphomicrobiales bacterium]
MTREAPNKPETSRKRCGFVALIGAPNAGKSTLLNRFAGAKIAIVTPKAQTTRAQLRAIRIHAPSQLIFIDTPGIFTPRRGLDTLMVQTARGGARQADIVLFMVDARTGLDADTQAVIEMLETMRPALWLVLNKVDAVKPAGLLPLSRRINEQLVCGNTFMISALTGDGVDDLLTQLAKAMPEGDWLYPADRIADVPLRFMAAEIVREKLFLRLRHELPYATTVETTRWTRRADGSVRIEQVIYVERAGQKKILLGKNGRMIRTIGQAAREELRSMLGVEVHLFLFVKLCENWQRDRERLEMMGLDLQPAGVSAKADGLMRRQ